MSARMSGLTVMNNKYYDIIDHSTYVATGFKLVSDCNLLAH